MVQRVGKKMLAQQYANLTFYSLIQEKLNESAALQRKVGPVLVTEFELDHGNGMSRILP